MMKDTEGEQLDLLSVPDFFDEHWQDMPEFNMEDLTSNHKIIVHFRDDADFKRFQDLIGQKIGDKQPSCWFPFMPHRKASNMVYIDEE